MYAWLHSYDSPGVHCACMSDSTVMIVLESTVHACPTTVMTVLEGTVHACPTPQLRQFGRALCMHVRLHSYDSSGGHCACMPDSTVIAQFGSLATACTGVFLSPHVMIVLESTVHACPTTVMTVLEGTVHACPTPQLRQFGRALCMHVRLHSYDSSGGHCACICIAQGAWLQPDWGFPVPHVCVGTR